MVLQPWSSALGMTGYLAQCLVNQARVDGAHLAGLTHIVVAFINRY